MVYYSAIKRKKFLTYTTTWLHFENIMLSERGQMQKTTYRVIPFICMSRTGLSIETQRI